MYREEARNGLLRRCQEAGFDNETCYQMMLSLGQDDNAVILNRCFNGETDTAQCQWLMTYFDVTEADRLRERDRDRDQDCTEDCEPIQDQDRDQDCTQDCEQSKDQDQDRDQDRDQDCTQDCEQSKDQDQDRDQDRDQDGSGSGTGKGH